MIIIIIKEQKQKIPENERSLKRTGEVKITMYPEKKILERKQNILASKEIKTC